MCAGTRPRKFLIFVGVWCEAAAQEAGTGRTDCTEQVSRMLDSDRGFQMGDTAPLIQHIQGQQEALQAATAELLGRLQQQQQAVQAVASKLVEVAKKAAEAEPRVRPYLSDRGWFVSYHFPIAWFASFEPLIQSGRHEEVEEAMC